MCRQLTRQTLLVHPLCDLHVFTCVCPTYNVCTHKQSALITIKFYFCTEDLFCKATVDWVLTFRVLLFLASSNHGHNQKHFCALPIRMFIQKKVKLFC